MRPSETPELTQKLIIQHQVCSHEVNHNQQLSIPILMGMLQEVAYRHAEQRGWGWSALKPKNQFWVLMRLQMEFDKFPEWKDNIQLETWATGTNGLFAKRSWNLYDHNNKSVIRCNSDWVVIDGTSRRIQRLDPKSFEGWYLPEAILDHEPSKLKPLKDKVQRRKYDIRLSEIDLMQHVNNANYVKWVMDALDLDFINQYEPAKLEVNFLKEAKFPETIVVNKEELSNARTLFSISSKNETVEHVRVMIDWKKRMV